MSGLGVAKFLVQLGVFASVLYTLLALDIDPVEQLVKLLPVSEVRMHNCAVQARRCQHTPLTHPALWNEGAPSMGHMQRMPKQA